MTWLGEWLGALLPHMRQKKHPTRSMTQTCIENVLCVDGVERRLYSSIQNLIEDQNPSLDETFSITKFIDLADPKDPGILGIAIPVVVAVAILLILIGIFCFFGCFKRMSPEEIAKQEGKQDSGFEKNNESTKMLDEVER